MSHGGANHIAARGPSARPRRARRLAMGRSAGPVPARRVAAKGVGRNADRHYDPVTGRKRKVQK